MTDASESIDLDELRGAIHVPREVIYGYPIEPGEVVEPGYVETCMCGEKYPCVTVRLADALEDEHARAESAERRIERVEDFIIRHYLDTRMGETVLAALNEGGKK